MKLHDLLNDLLREFANEDRAGAPPRVEAALLREFGARRRRRALPVWIAVAAAFMGLAIWLPRPAPVPRTEAPAQFYPLPDADTLLPMEYGTVVHVQLPREVLRLAGFAVNEERRNEAIEADVLLDESGRARAVRFLQ
jgi:hypothetical protein